MNYLQKVKCKATLKRLYTKTISKGKFNEIHQKSWNRIEGEFSGDIIGKRTLCDGEVDYDEQITFIPKEYFTAYLVSVNMNENPVYVLPEDITKL